MPGLEVTIEHKQAPDVQRLVASGDAEFGVADATDVMIARTANIPINYASTLYQSFPVAIIGAAADAPTDPLTSRAARSGRLGCSARPGTLSWRCLDAGGLTADDVTIREYPQFNQAEGLANGDVDLITGFRNNEPLQLHAQGFDVGVLTVDEFAPLPGPGVIVGDDLLETDLDLVRAFVEATAAAQAAVIEDPDLGFAAAEEAVPTISEDPEVARAVLDATIELWSGDGLRQRPGRPRAVGHRLRHDGAAGAHRRIGTGRRHARGPVGRLTLRRSDWR
jgi:NitT/TauT family transport system substrate-binding protein